MIYSDKIQLIAFIEEISDCEYAIVKIWEEFPSYYPGSDIDIFCVDINKVARRILSVGNEYLDQDFTIELSEENINHKQIDFMYGEQIDFRFDLYGAMPKYKNIPILDSYFYSLIDRSEVKLIKHGGIERKVFLPSVIDEMIIRYLDYLEYFEKRSSKIKHLDYVRNMIDQNVDIGDFLDRLYLYITLPPERTKRSIFRRKKMAIIDILKKIKNIGLVGTVKRILFGKK